MEEKNHYQFSATINENILELAKTGEVTKDSIDQLHEDVIMFLKGKKIKALLIDVRVVKVHTADLGSK